MIKDKSFRFIPYVIFILMIGLLTGFPGSAYAKKIKLYVALNGQDTNPGTKSKPFATVERAVAAIRNLKETNKIKQGSIDVLFRKGTYFLDKPIRLTADDAGTPDLTIIYQPYKNEEVTLSGGKIITGWENIGGNLWRVQLPEVTAGTWYFRQLFANGERKIRARTPNANAAAPYFLTTGPLSAYAAQIKPWDFVNRTTLFFNQVEAFCGFGFKAGDVQNWPDYQNAEVLTHHSWESSWQTIRKIDTAKNEIYFNTPSWCPIGFFGKESNQSRYIIENIKTALDQPGEWFLNKTTGELFYLAQPGEDVKTMSFVAPVLEELLTLEGTATAPIQNLTFSGLKFQHNNYPMGIYINTVHIKGEGGKPLVKVDWPNFVKKQYPDWPTTFNPGYMEPQAAVYAGQAILVKDAANINFTNCEVAHTGNYGIYIADRSHGVTISRCRFFDMGAGGIKLGVPVKDVKQVNFPAADIPYQNTIADNTIHDIGKTIPGGVGIWLAQTRDNQIIHNELYNMPYSGISMGWTWSAADTYTQNNIIAHNHIHHVLQTITDGGGIYTLGNLNGSTFRGNYIHDIVRHPLALGGDSQGIFFDESSRNVTLEGNVITNTKSVIGFNATKKENMIWKENYLEAATTASEKAQEIVKKSGPRQK